MLLFATGEQIDDEISSTGDDRFADFQAALDGVLLDLAHQIVRDGEGATKFVEIEVTGAASDDGRQDHRLRHRQLTARQDGAGGRGRQLGPDRHGRRQGRGRPPIATGWPSGSVPSRSPRAGCRPPDYSEERATAHLQADEVRILVDVGVGNGAATIWTCDLTHGYIDINAGYRS